MDRILIEGLAVQARVGVLGQERRRFQPLVIDVAIGLDLRSAGRSDRVDATVDYAAVAGQVKGFLKARSFHLVEALADGIAKRILDRFRPVEVRVRVRKFSVPGAASVGAEIIRRRARRKKRTR